tara:strand:- start:333 stop:1961 length:1629 start_codon:yes stop_codon:yes gene_type:complete
MANIKFSAFTQKVVQTNVDFLVGYTGADNVRITPAALGDGIYLPLGGGTMAGNIVMGGNQIKFADAGRLYLGDSNDLQIYHNATDSHIDNYTGNLNIVNNANGADINFYSDDGAGGVEIYFYLDGSAGGTAPQTVFPDNAQLVLGSTENFILKSNGSNSYVENYIGDLSITNYANDKDIIFQSDNGSGAVSQYFRLDGSWADGTNVFTAWPDNSIIALGDGADLQIYHDASNSFIDDTGTGGLYIRSNFLVIGKYTGELGILALEDGTVELYYDNSKKLETTATGVKVTDEVSIGTSLVHTGDTDTKVTFGTNNITLITGGATHFIAESDQTTILYSGNAQTLFCDTNQRVGIGTATPAESLQIVNGDHFQLRLGTDATYYEFGRNYNTGALWIQGSQVGYNNIVLAPTSGNVGIGIAAPLFKLQVSGSVALDVMPTHESEGIVRIGRYDANTSRYNDIKSYVSSTAASNYLKLSVHGGVADATVDVMTLLGDGNVGIGTATPTAALQVVGLAEHADNAAALTAGLTAGAFYRTGDLLKVVH